MSLVSDTDFLIHSLRLSYLRDVEDPYGPRIITLDPSYSSNPFIMAASMADVERRPELAMPFSPEVSDDEAEHPSGSSGVRLKYTQTIMGGRSGGLGLRVHGKKASTSKRLSGTPRQVDVQNFVSGNAPVLDIMSTSAPVVPSKSLTSESPPVYQPVEHPSPEQTVLVHILEPTIAEETPVQKVVQFVPKFKGAAEMEARRQMRMAARRAPRGLAQHPPLFPNPESSSDEENPLAADSSSDDSDFDDDAPGEVDSMDEGDPFDLEYPSEPIGVNSDIDVLSFSADTFSISTSSGPISTSSAHVPRRSSTVHLSPVSESERPTDGGRRSRIADSLTGMSFEMVTPAHSNRDARKQERPIFPYTAVQTNTTTSSIPPPPSDNYFTKKQVTPIKPLKSALSAMLASADSSSNPFAELYAAISGRGESVSEDVVVYFPHATQPRGKSMELNVRKDATVEEVIGFSLWTYWKEGWLPKIDEGLTGEDDPKWETRVSAVGWILRIAEEDGEVDDDFPPPDRLGRASKFNADAYAVLEATPIQIQQNQLIESKIQRHPSRMTKKAERMATPAPSLLSVHAPSSTFLSSTSGSVPLSTSLGPSSSHGPPIFLRIRVADTADTVHISTTIPVSAGMYMQEALELVCRKRKLSNPNDYALLLGDMSILIPLDRTVASLQGKRELLLVKTSMLPQIGDVLKVTGKTTDPNASIFKRMSDTPEIQYPSLADYTAGYKKYTIFRKAPMLLARQERTLAIDGVYVHIMPSTNKAMKAVFDSGKTSSYHIKSIADCMQSTQTSSVFKLVLNRGGANKIYAFEAESPKLAGEIVQTIRSLKASLDRSATISKSRKSKHVV